MGALLGLQRQQILAVEQRLSSCNLVAVTPGERVGEGAFAGAVWPHDGMHFTLADFKIQAVQDGFAFDVDSKVVDREHSIGFYLIHPTAPSSVIFNNFCASTANSIGSSRKTSLQKPLTIIEMAFSSERPRWRQ